MLFLLCLLFCSSFAYGMEVQNDIKKFVAAKNAVWKKEEEKRKKIQKQKEKDSEARSKLAELERKKQEKRQRKAEQDFQKMFINAGATKAATKTMGWSLFKKKKRPAAHFTELPDDEGKTKTL